MIGSAGAVRPRRRSYRFLHMRRSSTPVLLLSLLLAACGGSDKPKVAAQSSPSATPTPIIEKVRGNPTPFPAVTPSGRKEPTIRGSRGTPPAKLVVRDLEPGTGPVIAPGQALTVDYKGVFYETGKAFDSSWGTGEPYHFILGAGQVLKGWDQGLKGMRVGGLRQLTIPPELAYGDHGQATVPPNATLVFVIDLLDARKP